MEQKQSSYSQRHSHSVKQYHYALFEDLTTDPLAFDEDQNLELSFPVPEIGIAPDPSPEPDTDPLDILCKIERENDATSDYIKKGPSSSFIPPTHFVAFTGITGSFEEDKYDPWLESAGISLERDPLMLKHEMYSAERIAITKSVEMKQKLVVLFDKTPRQFCVAKSRFDCVPMSKELSCYSNEGGVKSAVGTKSQQTGLIAVPPPLPAGRQDGCAPDRTSEKYIAGQEIVTKPPIDVSSLIEHHAMHNNPTRPKCNLCMKKFPFYEDVQRHRLICHLKEGFLRCKICRRSFSSNRYFQLHNTHYHKATPVAPNACHLCGRKFLYTFSLESHLLNHRKQGLFICKVCNTSFYSKAKWIAHSRSQYECNVCDKSFCSVKNLLIHRATHSDTCNYDIVIKAVAK